MLTELKEKMDQTKAVCGSHGEETDKLIYALLQSSKQPNTDEAAGKVEALLLSGDEAGSIVESGTINAPIFTDQQQQFQWSSIDRPIAQLFRRMVDLKRTVSVQIPSRKATLQSYEPHKLAEVQQRFLHQSKPEDPWNVLDLASPLPHSILPYFLTGPNCQLLSCIRDIALMGCSSERTIATTDEWAQWRDVEEWVLLAEGGHNTVPHTDSHGYATWITIQEGLFGFGWLSHPSHQEKDAWMTNPGEYTGGQWRYVILRPGQTVFFGSGTVHYVFRLKHAQTLALGGHILQWNGIEQWMKVVLDQMRHPHITNEEMKCTIRRYIQTVASLVTFSIRDGRVEELGGKVVVNGFFNLVKVSHHQCRRPVANNGQEFEKEYQ